VAGLYRSLGYMRPLCIWSMHWALTKARPPAEELVVTDGGDVVVLDGASAASLLAPPLPLSLDRGAEGSGPVDLLA
jgi:hypothetical protein